MLARRITIIIISGAALIAPSAKASFGFNPGGEGLAASVTEADSSPATLAGEHPYEMAIHFGFNTAGGLADGDLRDLRLTLPPSMLVNPSGVASGTAGSPGAPAECSALQFHTPRTSPFQESLSGESCPDKSQVGTVAVRTGLGGGETRTFGLYNLTAPYGASEAIGFAPFGVPIELTARIREPDAALVFGVENLAQVFDLQGLDFTFWGVPWELAHDNERGNCLNEEDPAAHFGEPGSVIPGSPPSFHAGTCSAASPLAEPAKAYLSMPTVCEGPVVWEAEARSWQQPGTVGARAEAPPLAGQGCIEPLTRGKVQLRTEAAAAATGLVFNLDVNDGGGLLNNGGIVRSQIRTMSVELPDGLTINPSLGSGLGVCTEADFARESASTPPGAGCPNNSKIGDVSAEGILGLSEPVGGAVYLAKPFENRFDSLIALYIVASSARRGIFTKAVGKVEPDPLSGRLVGTFEDLPQLHYTHFSFSLREGQRAALVSPATCGTYRADITMTPWADPSLHVPDFSNFLITKGEAGDACPRGGLRPFAPTLEAGSINPQAGAYTPYYLHMTRADSDQEITSYSATLPPGLTGKLAGVPYCPDAAIEAAKGRSGTAELESPSCPGASRIGRTLAGYGVEGTLAYAPGGLYLAGPYHGAPLSVVAIDSALVGPFDLGVVVVRSAIRIDRRSARASIDSAGSDPIPHMLRGIPIHLRDIRVYIDRPQFTLNPTDCDPLGSLSTLTGAGADLFSSADDVAATSSDRYQVFNCSALGFSPRLRLKLKGGSRRGQHPALRATVTERPGDANIGTAVVALPHAEFLAQSHIRGICQAAAFATDRCPPVTVYGHARAFSPLLAEPLEGPVVLKSSPNPLPDMVAMLRGDGGIAIDVVGRIDSVRGAMRGSFEGLPDAPASKFVLTLFGGKRGLLENSANLCAAPSYASARFAGQNNATRAWKVEMDTDCGRHGHGHGKKGGRR
jgi:hypothetical protein